MKNEFGMFTNILKYISKHSKPKNQVNHENWISDPREVQKNNKFNVLLIHKIQFVAICYYFYKTTPLQTPHTSVVLTQPKTQMMARALQHNTGCPAVLWAILTLHNVKEHPGVSRGGGGTYAAEPP